MMPSEPLIRVARQGFADAQTALVGSNAQNLGFCECGWYGTNVDDERGSFAIVSETGSMASHVGEVLNVSSVVTGRSVFVYVHSTHVGLDVDLALARRPYLAVSPLTDDPAEVLVYSVDLSVVPS